MAQEVKIAVENIHCESCERTITRALSTLPGVLRVRASHETNVVVVQVQDSGTDEQALKAKLREVGYEPRA